MALACAFPGQGAQKVGMMDSLAAAYPEVEETFAEASEALGEDLWRLAAEGPDEELNQTRNSQPVLLAAEISIWRLWRQHGGPLPDYLAGHSFGEYSALVAAGALEFSRAVPLVRLRGDLMQQAVAPGVGSMAAVLGLEDGQVRDLCAQASSPDAVVEAANFNAPGQVGTVRASPGGGGCDGGLQGSRRAPRHAAGRQRPGTLKPDAPGRRTLRGSA